MKLSIIPAHCFPPATPTSPLYHSACNCQNYIIFKKGTKDVGFLIRHKYVKYDRILKSNIIPQAQLGYISKILPSHTALQNKSSHMHWILCNAKGEIILSHHTKLWNTGKMSIAGRLTWALRRLKFFIFTTALFTQNKFGPGSSILYLRV